MYAIQPLTGDHLPPKTLCLTYDDGPGEHTIPIAEFLFKQGIRATFFVVGKYAIAQPNILARLSEMGHIIGNHTYEHPDLPYYVSIKGDVQNQVLRTDALIKPYTNRPVFFRAPYGKWSAEVARELNLNLLCTLNHVGPIHWDVGGIDCYYWQSGKTTAEAIDGYRDAIKQAGRGIIVMHDDSADMDIVKPLNQTLELTQQLIPILQSEGYSFIGLDEVFTQTQMIEPDLEVYLQSGSRKFVMVQPDGSFEVGVKNTDNETIFIVEESDNGKIALKIGGMYMSTLPENTVRLIALFDTFHSRFDLIPVFNNRFILRTHNGNYININSQTGKLEATARYIRSAATFSYQPIRLPANTHLSISMRYQLLKRKLAFIKSKLLSR